MKPAQTQEFMYTLDDLVTITTHIQQLMQTCKVFTFTGPLGAGKTTLIRELLQRCGIQQEITSPTFTYVNIYTNGQKETFYHFDCYRISSLDGFLAAGFDEYLYQPHSWAFIEWPEVVEPILDRAVCHISIDYLPEADKRAIKFAITL